MSGDRCRWAIKFGPTLVTRCLSKAGHVERHPASMHEGPGLAQFGYQRIWWLPGDRREFETDRAERFAWEAAQ